MTPKSELSTGMAVREKGGVERLEEGVVDWVVGHLHHLCRVWGSGGGGWVSPSM